MTSHVSEKPNDKVGAGLLLAPSYATIEDRNKHQTMAIRAGLKNLALRMSQPEPKQTVQNLNYGNQTLNQQSTHLSNLQHAAMIQKSGKAQSPANLAYVKRSLTHDRSSMRVSKQQQPPQQTSEMAIKNKTAKAITIPQNTAASVEVDKSTIQVGQMLKNNSPSSLAALFGTNRRQSGFSRPTQYAKFKMSEQFKQINRPQNAPICENRLRELSQIVFEQKVASQFSKSISSMQRHNNQRNLPAHKTHQQFRTIKQNKERTEMAKASTAEASSNQVNFVQEIVQQKLQMSRSRPPYCNPQFMSSTQQNLRPKSHYNRATLANADTSGVIQTQTPTSGSTLKLNHYPSQKQPNLKFGQQIAQKQKQITVQVEDYQSHQTDQIIKDDAETANITNQASNQTSHINIINQQRRIKSGVPDNRRNLSSRTNISNFAALNTALQQQLKQLEADKSVPSDYNKQFPQTTTNSNPQTLGNELMIKKTKIFDVSSTISRQSRMEAHETQKMHKKLIKKLQISSEKKRKEGEGTKTTIIGLVANKDKQDPLTVPCSKLENPRSINNSQNERPTPIIDSKLSQEENNATVVTSHLQDRATSKLKTMSTGEQGEAQAFLQPTLDMDMNNNMTLYLESQASLNDKNLLQFLGNESFKLQKEVSLASPSTALPNFSKTKSTTNASANINKFRGHENFLSAGANKDYLKHKTIQLQQSFNGTENMKNNMLLQLYNNQINLEQKLEEATQYKTINSQKQLLDQISTKSEVMDGKNSINQRPPAIQINKIQTKVSPVHLRKFQLAKMRQDSHRQNALKIREQSSSGHKSPHVQSLIAKCTKKDINSFRKLSEKQVKNRVHIIPRVVEIKAENIPEGDCALSPRKEVEKEKNEVQNKNASQDDIMNGLKLGAIPEESVMKIRPSTTESNNMQALGFGGVHSEEDEEQAANNNLIDWDSVDPETRDFILYLQHVKPELLLSDWTSDNMIIAEKSIVGASTPISPKSTSQKSPVGKLKIDNFSKKAKQVKEEAAKEQNIKSKAELVTECAVLPSEEPEIQEVIMEVDSPTYCRYDPETERSKQHIVNSNDTLKQIPFISDSFRDPQTKTKNSMAHLQYTDEEFAQAVDLQQQQLMDLQNNLVIAEHGGRESGSPTPLIEDKPVDYRSQIIQMQEIFKGIAARREKQQLSGKKEKQSNKNFILKEKMPMFRIAQMKPIKYDRRLFSQEDEQSRIRRQKYKKDVKSVVDTGLKRHRSLEHNSQEKTQRSSIQGKSAVGEDIIRNHDSIVELEGNYTSLLNASKHTIQEETPSDSAAQSKEAQDVFIEQQKHWLKLHEENQMNADVITLQNMAAEMQRQIEKDVAFPKKIVKEIPQIEEEIRSTMKSMVHERQTLSSQTATDRPKHEDIMPGTNILGTVLSGSFGFNNYLGQAKQKEIKATNIIRDDNTVYVGQKDGNPHETPICSTQDMRLLENSQLKHLFNDKRFGIANYIKQLGPPRKQHITISNANWKRLKKAKFDYSQLDDLPKNPKLKSLIKNADQKMQKEIQKVFSTVSSAEERYNQLQNFISSGRAELTDKERVLTEEDMPMIETDGIGFNDPDRYKTDQQKLQALTLLVPGYVEFVHDVNDMHDLD